MKNHDEDNVEITIKQDFFEPSAGNHHFILQTSCYNLFIG